MSRAAVRNGAAVAAAPYAWPYHGTLIPAQTALVACWDPSWRPARPDVDGADQALAAIAAALGRIGGLVVLLASTPVRRRGPVNPHPATSASRLPEADAVVHSGGISGFHGEALDDTLRTLGARDLILAGWGLEGPVHSTMRAANDRGYECLLVGDACAASEPDLGFAAIDIVRHSGGIFGAVADSATLLRALEPTVAGAGAPRARLRDPHPAHHHCTHLDLEEH